MSNMDWLEQCESQEEKDFFKTKLMPCRSTFGTVTKVDEKPIPDDGYTFAFESVNWSRYKNRSGTIVPRPRIIKNLGSMQRPPGPGEYENKDYLRSKMTTAPAYTLLSKKNPKSFDEVKIPGPGNYELPDMLKSTLQKSDGKHELNGSTQKKASSSPGPGSYEDVSMNIYKYERDPHTALFPSPKKSTATRKPRVTLNTRTLELKERYNLSESQGPLKYDTTTDPRAISKSVTIGEKRDFLCGTAALKPDFPPGPGTYDFDENIEEVYEKAQKMLLEDAPGASKEEGHSPHKKKGKKGIKFSSDNPFGMGNRAINPLSLPLSKSLHPPGNKELRKIQRNGLTENAYHIQQKINNSYKCPYTIKNSAIAKKTPAQQSREIRNKRSTAIW